MLRKGTVPVLLGAGLLVVGVATPAQAQEYSCTVDVSTPASVAPGATYTVTFTPEVDCTAFSTTDASDIQGALENSTGAQSGTWWWHTSPVVTTQTFTAPTTPGVYTETQVQSGESNVSMKAIGTMTVTSPTPAPKPKHHHHPRLSDWVAIFWAICRHR